MDGGGVDLHKLIGRLPKPKGGFTLPGHKYTGRTMIWIHNYVMIQILVKFFKFLTNLLEKLMPLQCNMMWIIPFVEIIKNVRTPRIEKW